ncbi:holo-ACP synthase [Bacillaceae bacterium S4-13-58]
MIIGIGIDIVELSRIKDIMERKPSFYQRILSKNESEQFSELLEKRKMEYLAGRFAAKEAFSKAFGTGIGAPYQFTDIEVLNEVNGRPFVRVEGLDAKIFVSISHSERYAVAQVILEK